jgi:hypothetical protein
VCVLESGFTSAVLVLDTLLESILLKYDFMSFILLWFFYNLVNQLSAYRLTYLVINSASVNTLMF